MNWRYLYDVWIIESSLIHSLSISLRCKLFTSTTNCPNNEIAKIHWRNYKIFSRTDWPIQENKELFGDSDSRLFKWRATPFLKITSTELTNIIVSNNGPFSTKLKTKYTLVKGIQVYSNEGPPLFPKGDLNEINVIHWRNFTIFFSQTDCANFKKNLAQSSFGDWNSKSSKRIQNVQKGDFHL